MEPEYVQENSNENDDNSITDALLKFSDIIISYIPSESAQNVILGISANIPLKSANESQAFQEIYRNLLQTKSRHHIIEYFTRQINFRNIDLYLDKPVIEYPPDSNINFDIRIIPFSKIKLDGKLLNETEQIDKFNWEQALRRFHDNERFIFDESDEDEEINFESHQAPSYRNYEYTYFESNDEYKFVNEQRCQQLFRCLTDCEIIKNEFNFEEGIKIISQYATTAELCLFHFTDNNGYKYDDLDFFLRETEQMSLAYEDKLRFYQVIETILNPSINSYIKYFAFIGSYIDDYKFGVDVENLYLLFFGSDQMLTIFLLSYYMDNDPNCCF